MCLAGITHFTDSPVYRDENDMPGVEMALALRYTQKPFRAATLPALESSYRRAGESLMRGLQRRS